MPVFTSEDRPEYLLTPTSVRTRLHRRQPDKRGTVIMFWNDKRTFHPNDQLSAEL